MFQAPVPDPPCHTPPLGGAGLVTSPGPPLSPRVDTAGPYRVVVSRRAPTPAAARALDAAEALAPPRAVVLADAYNLTAADSAAPGLWWSGRINGLRQPYAATGAAARYYIALVDGYRAGTSGPDGGPRMTRAEAAYEASAAPLATWTGPGGTVRGGWVVRLQLDWVGSCGPMCGQSAHVGRTVVLSAAADRVLAVCGDGHVSGAVSVRPDGPRGVLQWAGLQGHSALPARARVRGALRAGPPATAVKRRPTREAV